MKFSHLTDTIILFDDEFDNFQTKLIRVGHNLHLKLGVQVLGCRSFALISVCDRDDAHVGHHLPQLMSP